MPSQQHEAWVEMFRNLPELAPKLLGEVLRVDIPEDGEASLDSAALTELQPTEYRADLVVRVTAPPREAGSNEPCVVLGIVVEVQLDKDGDKSFTWPVYAVSLRARSKCPVCLLAVCPDERVARWAAKPIDLGGGNWFTPLVLSPSRVPVVTDGALAQAYPELAVLSAMAHGADEDVERAARIALLAHEVAAGLDDSRARLYGDLALSCLSEAAQKRLKAMTLERYEYQSDFARKYVAEGRIEGRTEGRLEGEAKLLQHLLARRFGAIPDWAQARLTAAAEGDLMRWSEIFAEVASLEELFSR